MKTAKQNGSKATHSVPTVAIILAGGKSTRMGRDKAGLPTGRGRLVEHVAEILSRTLADVGANVWVSGVCEGLPSFPDQITGMGPLGGIHAAVHRFAGSRLLVVPVDMPALSEELFHTILSDASGLACCFDGFELPMVLHSTERVRKELDRLCSEAVSPRMRSVQELHSRLGVVRVPVPAGHEQAFLNANTPEAWRRWVELRSHRRH